jgi:hypothetical protein
MRTPRFQAQHLRDAFRRKKVLTRNELLPTVGCSSMTVWRLLKSCGYWTSYNFNGRFYTLADIPQFDERGLWAYQGIRFSKWGPLTETMIALVENSEAGMTPEQLQPTKEVPTKKVRAWLAELELPALDGLELNILVPQWDLLDSQLDVVEAKIAQRAAADEQVQLLESIPGVGHYSAVAIRSRIGDIDRFKHADSLANFFVRPVAVDGPVFRHVPARLRRAVPGEVRLLAAHHRAVDDGLSPLRRPA